MTRILTVGILWRQRQRGRREQLMPKIAVQGHWLEKSGFKEGDRVEVKQVDGGIFISKIAEKGP